MYKDLYLETLKKQAISQPIYKQHELKLARLTVGDMLTINLKFIVDYDGDISKVDFIKQCILLTSLRQGERKLYELNNVTTVEMAAQLETVKPDQFNAFWAVAGDYFLFINLVNTPPVPPDKVRFYDYTDKEQLQAHKNNLIAIHSMVKLYEVENNASVGEMALIDFAVIYGSLVINGGLSLADRVAVSLGGNLQRIAYAIEVNNIYTSAKDAKHPNQVIQSGFSRLKRAGYFQDTPLKALLSPRTKQKANLINEAKRQIKTMMHLKRSDQASYNEKLNAATDTTMTNLDNLLYGQPELKQLETIRADRETLKSE
jgi:hypothetical protein